MLDRRTACLRSLLLLVLLTGVPSGVRAAGVSAEATNLRIKVLGPHGPISDAGAYVAVVPRGGPPSVPVREASAVLPDGTIAWEVPGGEYDLICSAIGFQLARIHLPLLDGGRSYEETCRLEPLSRVTLRVVGAVSRVPVAGARVGPLRAFLGSYPGQLSHLGEQHARKNHIAVSDLDGVVSLPIVDGSKATLWAEVPGEGLALLPNYTFSVGSSKGENIRLERAGGLRVSLSEAEGHSADSLSVVLRSGDGAARAWMERLPLAFWRRPLVGGVAEWAALPSGRYEVGLDGEQLAQHAHPPVVLGSVEVRPGGVASLERSAPVLSERNTGPIQCQPVSVPVALSPDNARSLRAYRVSWRRLTSTPLRYSVSSRVDGFSQLSVENACCLDDFLVLASSGTVSPVTEFSSEDCDESTLSEIRLNPAGAVYGSVVGPEGAELPGDGVAVARACGTSGSSAPFSVTVGRSGGWLSTLPAGCSGITVWLQGFEPLQFTDVQVAAGGATDLGERTLEIGASVLTRVVDGDSGLPIAGAKVFVIGDSELNGPLPAAVFSGIELRPTCTADAGGWCRTGGLGAGSYRLRAVAPGYADTYGDTFTLRARSVQDLQDLRMRLAGELDLVIAEPLARLGTAVGLAVTAQHTDDCTSLPSLFRTLDLAGQTYAVLEGLAPGQWNVSLVATGDNRRAHLLESRQVQIQSGGRELAELGTFGSEVSGSVTQGSRPVEGTLLFRSRQPEPGHEGGVARSSRDGQFTVNLPNAGAYDVVVASDEPAGKWLLADVEVKEGERLVLEIPTGRVGGVVVDDEGNPVAGAEVEALQDARDNVASHRRAVTTHSGADGRWSADGLMDGPWAFTAYREAQQSDPSTVVVQHGNETDGVFLRLHSRENVRGRVVDPAGRGIQGARVSAMMIPGSPAQPLAGTLVETGIDGSFELARTGESANLEVSLSSGALYAFRVDLSRDFEIIAGTPTGSVSITGPEGAALGDRAGYVVFRNQQGGLLIPTRWLGTSAVSALQLAGLQAERWLVLELPHYAPDILRQLIGGLLPTNLVSSEFEVSPGMATQVELPAKTASP